MVTLKDVDKDDNENKADLVIALMQKDSRLKRLQTRQDSCEEYIQFKLFKVIFRTIKFIFIQLNV